MSSSLYKSSYFIILIKKMKINIIKFYIIRSLRAMVLGIFSSLIIGVMLKTIGNELNITFLEKAGTIAIQAMGSAIGIAAAWSLQVPPLVLFSCACCGLAGAGTGGPLGALLAGLAAAETGRRISNKTKLDIIVTPAISILTGFIISELTGHQITSFMNFIGNIIVSATETQPFISGAIIAIVMGMAMCTPFSSTAIAIMLDMHGIVAGAATVGCCCQLVGFAIAGYKDNGPSGLVSLGIGCAMLQLPNIIKNPYIWLPPICASALLGPFVTTIFPMENISAGAGMGSSGFVGQIGTLATMGTSYKVLLLIAIFHFILPGILAYIFSSILRRIGKIKDGDMLISTNI